MNSLFSLNSNTSNRTALPEAGVKLRGIGQLIMYYRTTYDTIPEQVTSPGDAPHFKGWTARPTYTSLGGRQPGNELEQDLEVWKRAGDAYLGLGGGVSWSVAGPLALRGEVDAAVVFPFGAVVLTPRAGVEVGF